MGFDPVSFTVLDDMTRKAVRDSLQRYRANLIQRQLLSAAKPGFFGRLGVHAPIVMSNLEQLHSWWASNREQFWKQVNHWSLTFCLARIAFQRATEAERSAGSANLAALYVLDHPPYSEGMSKDTTVVTITDGCGRILDLRTSSWVQLPFPPNSQIEWTIDHERATVRPLSVKGRTLYLDLPVRDDSTLERVPVPRLTGLEAAVFDSSSVLGVAEESNKRNRSGSRLSLSQSLAKAVAILEEAWPETLEWIRELVPAFASLGFKQDTRRSESYGPGTPIFLTRVEDPLQHAEDLVHELQHHRFHLWALDRPLASLEDNECRFVSPYRLDARPLFGEHLGVHAFVTVNELRLRASAKGLCRVNESLFYTHLSNLFAFRTIVEHERPDDNGRRYLVALARKLVAHENQIANLIPSAERLEIEKDFRHRCTRAVASKAGELINNGKRYLDWKGTLRITETLAAGKSL